MFSMVVSIKVKATARKCRGVHNFTDPDSSLFVTATGQSGHFLSRYNDDLGELWRRVNMCPCRMTLIWRAPQRSG